MLKGIGFSFMENSLMWITQFSDHAKQMRHHIVLLVTYSCALKLLFPFLFNFMNTLFIHKSYLMVCFAGSHLAS